MNQDNLDLKTTVKIFDVDGNFLSFTNLKSARSKKKNGRVVAVDGGFKFIRPLNFKINQRSEVAITAKCVCCDSDDRVTKHHVIPKAVLKYVPNHIKNKFFSSDYIVRVCYNCNRSAEYLLKSFHDGYTFKNPVLMKMKDEYIYSLKLQRLITREGPNQRASNKYVTKLVTDFQKQYIESFILEHNTPYKLAKYFTDIFMKLNPKYLVSEQLNLKFLSSVEGSLVRNILPSKIKPKNKGSWVCRRDCPSVGGVAYFLSPESSKPSYFHDMDVIEIDRGDRNNEFNIAKDIDWSYRDGGSYAYKYRRVGRIIKYHNTLGPRKVNL